MASPITSPEHVSTDLPKRNSILLYGRKYYIDIQLAAFRWEIQVTIN